MRALLRRKALEHRPTNKYTHPSSESQRTLKVREPWLILRESPLQFRLILGALKLMPSIDHLRSQLRRFFPLIAIGAIGITGIICMSCEDDVAGLGPSNIVFPDSGVSFGRHVDPLFQQSCVSSMCHGGSTPTSELNLETPSYRALIDHHPRLILTGDGANSLLIQRLTGEVGQRMPLKLQPLTENQINGIRRWIDEGAINN